MHIYIFARSSEVPQALRTYAESSVRRALQSVSNRVTWVAVRLTHREDHAVDSIVVCQLEAWLRGIDLVTAKDVNVDIYVAIDRAASRLKQAIDRKIHEEAQAFPSRRGGNAPPKRARTIRALSPTQKGTDHATSRHDHHPRRSPQASFARGSWSRV